MGIVGIPKKCFIVQCGHCQAAKAFWCSRNDGSEPPDLYWEGFPAKGRMLLMKETIILSCWNCRESLDRIVNEYGKTLQ